jgi:hypothetical protein
MDCLDHLVITWHKGPARGVKVDTYRARLRLVYHDWAGRDWSVEVSVCRTLGLSVWSAIPWESGRRYVGVRVSWLRAGGLVKRAYWTTAPGSASSRASSIFLHDGTPWLVIGVPGQRRRAVGSPAHRDGCRIARTEGRTLCQQYAGRQHLDGVYCDTCGHQARCHQGAGA